MKHYTLVSSITLVVFLLIDIPWLYFIMGKYMAPRIHHLMKVTPQGAVVHYGAALCAYVIMALALTHFVIIPHNKTSFFTIFLHGALMGFCLFGTYEFTNYATLIGWDLLFLLIDLCWGMVLCGVTSIVSITLLRFFLFL